MEEPQKQRMTIILDFPSRFVRLGFFISIGIICIHSQSANSNHNHIFEDVFFFLHLLRIILTSFQIVDFIYFLLKSGTLRLLGATMCSCSYLG